MKIIRGIYSPIPTSYSTRMMEMVSVTLNTNPQKRPTVSKIIKGYLHKYSGDYLKEYELEMKKNVSVSTSIDMEKIELNNLKLQLQDLGVIGEEVPTPQPKNEVLPLPEKPKPPPSVASNLNSNYERYPPNNTPPVVPSRREASVNKVEA